MDRTLTAVGCDSATSPRIETNPGRTEGTRASLVDLWALDEAMTAAADGPVRALADWVRGYLMRPHADLGRSGHVCPFTATSARLALLRIGISPLDGHDRGAILRTMRQALHTFDAMPCTRSTRIFRTVVVGFPACADPTGVAALRHVQNALRHHSVVRARMIGLFEPDSQAEGLINRSFRPLRSPIPVLAIRMLVEQDAPFVARNPLLVPIYLLKFPFAGTRRLIQGVSSSVGRPRRAG